MKFNAAGPIPTIVYAVPLRFTLLPITEASPPKRRFHRPSLIIATRCTAGPILPFAESAPPHWLDPQHRHQRWSDRGALELLRVAAARQREIRKTQRGQVQAPRLLLPRKIVQHRGAKVRQVEFLVLLRHAHQPVGRVERQRPQHHRVHHAENGRVGTDGQCHGQHSRGRENRRPAQRARGITKIAQQHRAGLASRNRRDRRLRVSLRGVRFSQNAPYRIASDQQFFIGRNHPRLQPGIGRADLRRPAPGLRV